MDAQDSNAPVANAGNATRKQRGMALALDIALPLFVAIPGGVAFAVRPEGGDFTTTLLVSMTGVVLAAWLSGTVVLLVKESRTLGQVLQGIRVVGADGGRASIWQSLIVPAGSRVVRVDPVER